MKLREAFEIILELASDNMLTENEASQDPEILIPEMKKQEKALGIVINKINKTFI